LLCVIKTALRSPTQWCCSILVSWFYLFHLKILTP
jgi:hypothetical protein